MDFQAGLKHLKHSDYMKSPICSTLLELLPLLMQVLMLLLLCLLVNKTRWLMLESLCWVFNPLCFLTSRIGKSRKNRCRVQDDAMTESQMSKEVKTPATLKVWQNPITAWPTCFALYITQRTFIGKHRLSVIFIDTAGEAETLVPAALLQSPKVRDMTNAIAR